MIRPLVLRAMQDQAELLELLQHAVTTMAEELLELKTELTALHRQLQSSDQLLLQLMAKADRVDAMQANLSALERRLLQPRRPAPRRRRSSKRGRVVRRLALLLLAGLSVASGLALMIRSLWIRRDATSPVSAVREQPQPGSTLLLTAKGPTWLEVQTSSGRTLHYGLAKPGTYSFAANPSLRIRAGRPDLVMITFAGSTAPLGSIDATGWHLYKHQRT